MKYLLLNGKRFAYYMNEENDKPAIVLLHGWPETSKIWEKIIPKLKNSYRVLAIDLPGLGNSDGVEKYDTGTISKYIRAIAFELGIDRFHLCSHDVGSWVASTYALMFPEDLYSLTLIDAGIPGILPDAFFALDNFHRSWHFFFHAVPELPEFLIDGRVKEYISWFYHTKSYIKGAISENDITYYAKLYQNKLSSSFGYYRDYSESVQINKALLKKLSLPVLTIGGEHAVGEKMREVAIALSDDWDFHNIIDCGHFVPEEQPAVLFTLLNTFLRRGKG